MIREALRYLFTDQDEALTTILVGGTLTFFTFLLLPHLILFGYFVQLLHRSHDVTTRPPRFDDWRRLLRDGANAYVIWLAWTALPLAVSYLVFRGDLDPGEGTVWLLGWFVPGNLLTIFHSAVLADHTYAEPYILSLLVLYFFPASLFCYLEHGSFRAAFRTANLNPILTSTRYFAAWLGFAVFWILAEAPLRLWTYGVFLVPLAFYLKATAWIFITHTFTPTRSPDPTATSTPGRRLPDANHLAPGLASIGGVPLKLYLAGGFLLSLGLYVLPGVLMTGYCMRVIRARPDQSMPALSGFWALVHDGIRAYAAWLVVALLPLSLLAITVLPRWGQGSARANLATWGVLSGLGLPGGYPAVLLFLLGSFGVLTGLSFLVTTLPSLTLLIVRGLLSLPVPVVGGVVIASMYVLPGAVVTVARTQSLRAGFTWQRIRDVVWQPSYPVVWVTVVGVTLPGWLAVFWAYAQLLPSVLAVLPATSIVALVPLPDLRVVFPVPAAISSVRAVVVWVFLLIAGILYSAGVLTASRVLSRL